GAEVSLQVFDASGRVVRTLISGRRAAGTYTTTWNGKDDAGRKLARGIYFVRLKTLSEMTKTKTILAR
ncbi:MAG: T9SS type A sorting domain-containing protein, partial [candidate division WOR-3 bacterium]